QPEDIEEVEDVADDRDYLPPDYGVAPVNPQKMRAMEKQVAKVLELSDAQIRGEKSAAIAIVRGTASPWQGLALDVQAILSPTNSVGLIIGTGEFEEKGEVSERSFDLTY